MKLSISLLGAVHGDLVEGYGENFDFGDLSQHPAVPSSDTFNGLEWQWPYAEQTWVSCKS